jgi:hypothetical protein
VGIAEATGSHAVCAVTVAAKRREMEERSVAVFMLSGVYRMRFTW